MKDFKTRKRKRREELEPVMPGEVWSCDLGCGHVTWGCGEHLSKRPPQVDEDVAEVSILIPNLSWKARTPTLL